MTKHNDMFHRGMNLFAMTWRIHRQNCEFQGASGSDAWRAIKRNPFAADIGEFIQPGASNGGLARLEWALG